MLYYSKIEGLKMLENYSDLISRLGYSIAEFVTTYFQTRYTFFVTQINDPTSPARICLGFGIVVIILIQLVGRIYEYITKSN